MGRTGWDLWILHLGWHRNQFIVLDGNSPAPWDVGLHTGSAEANGVLPANGCDLFWHWLHITRQCFKIWHKQFGSGCTNVWPWYRRRIPLTSHGDGKIVNTHMQWKMHDYVSACSGQYPCENQKELQLWCAICQALTSQRPEESPADRRGVLVQVTDSAKRGKPMLFCCFRRKGNPM